MPFDSSGLGIVLALLAVLFVFALGFGCAALFYSGGTAGADNPPDNRSDIHLAALETIFHLKPSQAYLAKNIAREALGIAWHERHSAAPTIPDDLGKHGSVLEWAERDSRDEHGRRIASDSHGAREGVIPDCRRSEIQIPERAERE